ncbi:MAG: DUF4389 domain-containing protein [Parvibaculales bacterium]
MPTAKKSGTAKKKPAAQNNSNQKPAKQQATKQEAPLAALHISKEPIWAQILYMICFGTIAYIGLNVAVMVAIISVLFGLLKLRAEHINRFARQLNTYLHQCIGVLLRVEDKKPFPFTGFPDGK